MNVLHILKQEPTVSVKRIIELHQENEEVTVIDLNAGPVSYDTLVAAVFASDTVFCW